MTREANVQKARALEENPEGPGVWFHLFLLHISWAPTLFQDLGWPWGYRQKEDVVPACTPLSLLTGGDKLWERLKHCDWHSNFFVCLVRDRYFSGDMRST